MISGRSSGNSVREVAASQGSSWLNWGREGGKGEVCRGRGAVVCVGGMRMCEQAND